MGSGVGGEKHGDKAGVMGVLSPLPPFSGIQLQLPLVPMGGQEGAGSPSGLQGWVRGSPRMGFPGGKGGGGFVHRVPGKGGPFLFYKINIHHLLCLTVCPAIHPGACPSHSPDGNEGWGKSGIPNSALDYTFPKEL